MVVFTESLPRNTKEKDVDKLKAYLGHLRRAQKVDRTWNFPHSTISNALKLVNKDPRSAI